MFKYINIRNLPIFAICILIIGWIGLLFLGKTKTSTEGNPHILTTSQQFILMGDVGTGLKQQFEVADAIKSRCSQDGNCQAAFLLGDLIYENGILSAKDTQLKTKLENPYKDLNFPFYLVLGNHDYKGCTDCYLDYSKTNPKWNFPSRYNQKDFEHVSFFTIDTENFDSKQQDWLSEAIKNSSKPWKIVVGHRPIISEEESKKGESWTGQTQLEEIVCKDVDFYISGHAHLLEDRGANPSCKAHFLISGSGGSVVRKIATPFTGAFYAEENGFLSLIVKESSLKYSYINRVGRVLYEQ